MIRQTSFFLKIFFFFLNSKILGRFYSNYHHFIVCSFHQKVQIVQTTMITCRPDGFLSPGMNLDALSWPVLSPQWSMESKLMPAVVIREIDWSHETDSFITGSPLHPLHKSFTWFKMWMWKCSICFFNQ